MFELSIEQIKMVSGGGAADQSGNNYGDSSNDKNDPCSWKNFGKSVAGGAITGAIGGAASGAIAAGVGAPLGAGVGAVGGSIGGGAYHLATCWW
ncbi:hypothetical protein C0159_08385 [Moraxella catarrhalis]|nr:hypothetical protein [Moraxella catarrhalis]MPW87902.1 hypothetical protein [Moraxella catarrhalis]MPW90445.1 hypothetical protein [Moraxella catarrhalis]MPW95048.1 hypothetical protein [Moraxella catarrhalis]MPX26425.1 hypothetical protein [Moraxella catarrhalis]MPX31559.1 hypothetical protein [Moraxella catarrhalis]